MNDVGSSWESSVRLSTARLAPLVYGVGLVIRRSQDRIQHLAEFFHKFPMYCGESALCLLGCFPVYKPEEKQNLDFMHLSSGRAHLVRAHWRAVEEADSTAFPKITLSLWGRPSSHFVSPFPRD